MDTSKAPISWLYDKYINATKKAKKQQVNFERFRVRVENSHRDARIWKDAYVAACLELEIAPELEGEEFNSVNSLTANENNGNSLVKKKRIVKNGTPYLTKIFLEELGQPASADQINEYLKGKGKQVHVASINSILRRNQENFELNPDGKWKLVQAHPKPPQSSNSPEEGAAIR